MSKNLSMNAEPVMEEPEETGTGRGLDPEILAMSRVLRLLADLDEPARGRVVRWLADRYDGDNHYVYEPAK